MAKFEKLTVPDPAKLSHVQEICDISEPYRHGEDMDELFLQAMREIMEWHYSRNTFYRNLLDREQFS
ncbi:MAG: hypothetical protein KAT31_08630, partial [Bacteroidales bacterium]|nr:hypothetical protein [Bacteroidales bacterium]